MRRNYGYKRALWGVSYDKVSRVWKFKTLKGKVYRAEWHDTPEFLGKVLRKQLAGKTAAMRYREEVYKRWLRLKAKEIIQNPVGVPGQLESARHMSLLQSSKERK